MVFLFQLCFWNESVEWIIEWITRYSNRLSLITTYWCNYGTVTVLGLSVHSISSIKKSLWIIVVACLRHIWFAPYITLFSDSEWFTVYSPKSVKETVWPMLHSWSIPSFCRSLCRLPSDYPDVVVNGTSLPSVTMTTESVSKK